MHKPGRKPGHNQGRKRGNFASTNSPHQDGWLSVTGIPIVADAQPQFVSQLFNELTAYPQEQSLIFAASPFHQDGCLSVKGTMIGIAHRRAAL